MGKNHTDSDLADIRSSFMATKALDSQQTQIKNESVVSEAITRTRTGGFFLTSNKTENTMGQNKNNKKRSRKDFVINSGLVKGKGYNLDKSDLNHNKMLDKNSLDLKNENQQIKAENLNIS